MKTLIALDIDCVLLPHHDESYDAIQRNTLYDRWGKLTGFKDWRRVEKRYFTFVSADQHALIQQVGDVHWLTTWIKDNIHTDFERETGIGPFMPVKPQDWTAAEYLYAWWKMGYLYLWIRENSEHVAQYDRLLWVDDDHRERTHQGLQDVVSTLSRLGTELIVVRPEGPVWSREEIEQYLPEDYDG
jgi:hypothetical protein